MSWKALYDYDQYYGYYFIVNNNINVIISMIINASWCVQYT